jgi:hypothetical protein
MTIGSGIQKLLGGYTYSHTWTTMSSLKPAFTLSKEGK